MPAEPIKMQSKSNPKTMPDDVPACASQNCTVTMPLDVSWMSNTISQDKSIHSSIHPLPLMHFTVGHTTIIDSNVCNSRR